MDHYQAAKHLGKELEEKGYEWELDSSHKHPRLIIKSGGKSKWTTLSSTAKYNQGKLLAMKRSDISRDLLPLLPKPLPEALRKVTAQVLPGGVVLPEEPETKVTGIKVFIMGRGSLVVAVPKSAVPKDKERAQVYLTSDSKLYLIFGVEGRESGKSRAEDKVAYYFTRSEVNFSYAERTPGGYKCPELCARFRGNSLVCDEPLPQVLITGKLPKGTGCSLSDGKEIRKMLNDWITEAEKGGLNPRIAVVDNRVQIAIEIKTMKEI